MNVLLKNCRRDVPADAAEGELHPEQVQPTHRPTPGAAHEEGQPGHVTAAGTRGPHGCTVFAQSLNVLFKDVIYNEL